MEISATEGDALYPNAANSTSELRYFSIKYTKRAKGNHQGIIDDKRATG